MADETADKLNERTPDVQDDAHRDKGTAVLIVDMIQKFDHDDGEELFKNALPAADNTSRLKGKAAASNIPVIYVNDNFGDWKHDFKATVEAARGSERGKQIVELIEPGPNDYHVLKPQHSGFFSTPLDVLLASLKASTLILTGVATDICILATAHDAYMRGFELIVPGDCTAATTNDQKSTALDLLSRIVKANTGPSVDIDFPQTLQNKGLAA
jgi:nicotinamidase-related amidase